MKGYITIFISLVMTGIVFGQVKFSASVDDNDVTINNRISLTLTSNVRGSITLAPTNDFSVVYGSTGSNFSNINGTVTRTYTNNYVLTPNKTGTYTIPEAILTYNGKKYKSNSITIKVRKPDEVSNSGAAFKSNKNYIGVISVSKKKIYEGESVLVTYKLYAKYQNILNYQPEFGSTSGFWKQELEPGNPRGWEAKRESVNGIFYIVYTLKKDVLYAQQHGKVKISPFKATLQIRRSFFERVAVDITSNSPSITVSPLPKGKPTSFSGSVGKFKMDASVSRSTLKAGDAFDLKLKISGEGNLSLLEEPEIIFPDDFEVLDPEIENKSKLSSQGLKGSKTYQYSIITSHSGEYRFGPIKFSYYNPKEKKYKTLTSEEFVINVEKGENEDESSTNFVGEPTKKEIKIKNKGIRYLKEFDNDINKPNYFFGSIAYYATLLSPGILFLVFLFIKKRKEEEGKNNSKTKVKKASKIATKKLSKGKNLLDTGDVNSFYTENLQALYGYLGDKLSMQIADFSKEYIQEQLIKSNVSNQTAEEYVQLLTDCEIARFAQSGEGSGKDIYDRSLSVIEKIEEELKK